MHRAVRFSAVRVILIATTVLVTVFTTCVAAAKRHVHIKGAITSSHTTPASLAHFNHTIETAIVNIGPYFAAPENVETFGKLENSSEPGLFDLFLNVSKRGVTAAPYSDGEYVDAIEHYFYNQKNGVVLECGALDGKHLSMSRPLHESFDRRPGHYLGWHRILVEGAPRWKDLLPKNSPDAYSFNTAICGSPQWLHYIDEEVGGSASVGGIVEFMNHDFLKTFHPQLLNLTRDELDMQPAVTRQLCFPMSDVISVVRISHINLFILDVEGIELKVLRTINFEDVLFDAIVVEVEDKSHRAPGNENAITAFLADKGYRFSARRGRNNWYVHQWFQPKSRSAFHDQS